MIDRISNKIKSLAKVGEYLAGTPGGRELIIFSNDRLIQTMRTHPFEGFEITEYGSVPNELVCYLTLLKELQEVNYNEICKYVGM